MSQPADPPELVVVTRIDSQIASLAAGTNLFQGPSRPPSSVIPHLCVNVQSYGGRSHADMGVSREDRFYRLQVRVRGNVDGYAEARTLAREIITALDRYAPGSGWVEIRVSDAGPIDLGIDDTEHPIFVINLTITYSG